DVVHDLGDAVGFRRRTRRLPVWRNGRDGGIEIGALAIEVLDQLVDSWVHVKQVLRVLQDDKAKSTAAAACSAVVSKTGIFVLDCLTSSGISVQPRMAPCVPSSFAIRPMISR